MGNLVRNTLEVIHRGAWVVVGWMLGGDVGVKVDSKVEAQVCIPHDLKWSNVPGVKLSSLSKSDDTFSSLQALSDLYYLFGGFWDYLWSRELDISNFGPADRKILPMESLVVSANQMASDILL
nr:hypothetical protein [Tanacetum cinerariifolium]